MALSNSQDNWCEEDIAQLLERMENNLPPCDNHTFKIAQAHMDWAKVAFKDFSGEMCKLKWLEISRKIRKYRTLTELVLEAKEHVKSSYQSKKLKKHPDMPKKPLTAYLRFFKEKRPEYSRMHPKLNNQDLTKVMSEKYKALPEEMKLKYMEDFQKEKQEFQEKLAQFRKDHPEPEQNSKTSVVPKGSRSRARKKFKREEKELKSSQENDLWGDIRFPGEPEKPPMNAYHKFHRDVWSSEELQGLPPMQRMVEICRLWQHVPMDQRELYEQQAVELQKQYTVDLDKWLKTLSPEGYAAFRERSSGKPKMMNMRGGPYPKIIRTHVQSPSARTLQEGLSQEEQELQAPEMESSETSQESDENKEDGGKAEGRASSDSSSASSDPSSEDVDVECENINSSF